MKRAILMGPLADSENDGWKALVHELAPSEERDYLVGVDGGAARWLGFGFRPHLAVGDWDSLAEAPRDKLQVLEGVRQVSLSKEKDYSDTWHAIELAVRGGARRIIGVGLTGGRPDHHLAVLLDFARAASRELELEEVAGPLAEVRLEGVDGSYFFLSEKIPAWKPSAQGSPSLMGGRLRAGRTVSVFAIGGAARGVTIRGMKYALHRDVLRPGSHGLSNETTGGPCEVSLEHGQLLVVVPSGIDRR